MRLIDADAYKKHLASFVVGGEEAIVKNGIGNYWIDGIHTAYREIDNAPTIKTFTLADIEEQYRKGLEKGLKEARPHGEWIPVSERLPEKNGYYLVTTDGSHNDVIDIAEYGKFYRKPEHEYVLEWNKASKILAWMPLPKPYKKEGEAE